VVGEVGRATGPPVDRVEQIDVTGRSLAHAFDGGDRVAVHDTGEEHLRVKAEAGEPIAAYGAGIRTGGNHTAQAPAAVLHGGRQELDPDALALVLWPDREGGQDPHQLADARDGAAHDCTVHLGDPATCWICRHGVDGCARSSRCFARLAAAAVGPRTLEGTGVDLEVAGRGDVRQSLGGRPPERAGSVPVPWATSCPVRPRSMLAPTQGWRSSPPARRRDGARVVRGRQPAQKSAPNASRIPHATHVVTRAARAPVAGAMRQDGHHARADRPRQVRGHPDGRRGERGHRGGLGPPITRRRARPGSDGRWWPRLRRRPARRPRG
jgi:hypothetical protein